MELIFVRHGHGEHLKDYPDRLNTLHPDLTDYGVHQIIQLRRNLPLHSDDLIVASPTERTIQTAEILTQSNRFYVSPCVGPRMFPQMTDAHELLCDRIYTKSEIASIHRGVEVVDFDMEIWEDGINRIDHSVFAGIASQFLLWCSERAKRTIIISHDGTITNYRLVLGEKDLTRDDFLGEAGVYRTTYKI